MQAPTTPELRSLRARAHHLRPVVAVGTHGLTPAVLHEIDVALKAHELIKIRVFNDVRSERDALLAKICSELACAGSIAIRPVAIAGFIPVRRTPVTSSPATVICVDADSDDSANAPGIITWSVYSPGATFDSG